MILWKEYQKIKEKGGDWTDSEVRILLNFCWETQIKQHEIAKELGKALEQVDLLRKRIAFYRQLHPLKVAEDERNKT